MIRAALVLAATVAVATPAAAQTADPARLAGARAAVKGLGSDLKAALIDSLKSGGPIAAIETCRQVAPTIAAEQSTAHGVKVGRTALKVRNPANAPDAFERRVLEDFAAKIAAGADPDTLDHAETVVADGRTLFRYMKAIAMGKEPCALCHGTAIDPKVAAEIAARYPQDQATGFTPGELRGAFTVTEVVK